MDALSLSSFLWISCCWWKFLLEFKILVDYPSGMTFWQLGLCGCPDRFVDFVWSFFFLDLLFVAKVVKFLWICKFLGKLRVLFDETSFWNESRTIDENSLCGQRRFFTNLDFIWRDVQTNYLKERNSSDSHKTVLFRLDVVPSFSLDLLLKRSAAKCRFGVRRDFPLWGEWIISGRR